MHTHTQNTQTQRIQELITRASNLRKANNNAEDCELSSGDDMEHPLELDAASSSNPGHPAGQQVDLSNYIHVMDSMGSVRNLENDRRLTEFEIQRRMREISGNNKTKFKQELYEISGEKDMKIIQQQNDIDDLMTQIPPPYLYSEARPTPFHADTA